MMLDFTLRRLNLLFFTLLMLSIVAFSLNYLFPGDALINMSGEIAMSESRRLQLIELYHFDAGIFSQYIAYMGQIFSANFGVSMATSAPISSELMIRLPATIELCLAALTLALLLGMPLGFVAAIFHNSPLDKGILAFAMLGYSIPVFWLALILILVFSITLSWLPSAGQLNLLFDIETVTGFKLIDILISDSPHRSAALRDALLHLILPSVAVALAPMTIFIRLARTSMLDVLDSNYIKAARAKGLSKPMIIYRHGIRNALVGIVRQVGLQFANIVTIAMIAEVIFAWQGAGSWLIESIEARDYTAIQGGLIALATFTFVINIIADFMYVALNPLERYKKHGG
ncbi:ABC transporter permease subunit [Thalassotalea ponticola]|uniref:ABC transporter permease subunit n=1 Tax=Thalassotalea ponticola TaxID=1523392 RepID=UPI0025B4A299|nr:ABC transporter permease subunit [Thalassotalea ponticola]MDN3653168.1 ABC transporter permease subunit [Thalassotalea ponticola]